MTYAYVGEDSAKFHHTTQNSVKFNKTYELFISGIFHLIFSDCYFTSLILKKKLL